MDWFKSFPMGAYAIGVGTIAAIAWVTVGGTVALVVSILAGGSIALKAALGEADDGGDDSD